MTLPRFISGKLGPATAADMNRVMAATEQVEGLRSIGRGGETFQTKRVLGRLTQKVTGLEWEGGYECWEWEQVVATHPEPGMPWQVVKMAGGLWHGMFGANPAYAIAFSSQSPGAIVELFRVPVQQGTEPPLGAVFYAAIPMVSDVGGRVGVIKAVTETGDPTTLGYAGYIVGLVTDAGTDMFSGSGALVPSVNMFELASQLQQDVKTKSPGTKTLIRLAVGDPVGPLVKLTTQAGPLWAFTMPNAYKITCGNQGGEIGIGTA